MKFKIAIAIICISPFSCQNNILCMENNDTTAWIEHQRKLKEEQEREREKFDRSIQECQQQLEQQKEQWKKEYEELQARILAEQDKQRRKKQSNLSQIPQWETNCKKLITRAALVNAIAKTNFDNPQALTQLEHMEKELESTYDQDSNLQLIINRLASQKK